jgi:solute carrier family 30 (zinc transporter), member 2
LSVEERQREKEEKSSKALKQLYIASGVSMIFVVLQLIGGILANSIAIMSDTAHLSADLIGFLISIFSIKMALRPADKALSYGYDRAEILGTILSVVFLWGLTIWLLYEATLRLFDPPTIQEDFMMITAWAGLLFNIIQLTILGHGHDHGHGGHDHGHGHGGHGHGGHGHDHGHGHSHEKKNSLT